MEHPSFHEVKALMLEPPLTLNYFLTDLGRDESIILEFPSGRSWEINCRSFLNESERALPILKHYKYDWLSKTYYLKTEYRDDKLIIKPANSHYGIDPIGNIKEWYGILYGTNLKIKKVILSGPATIIFWDDGDMTVVKAQDEIDHEKGILYAALKKLATKKEYNDILRAIDKEV